MIKIILYRNLNMKYKIITNNKVELMCNIDKNIIPYQEENAIPSWFGYEYQGKITIWFVVDFIYSRLKENNIQDYNNLLKLFKDYSLEIEKLEDFAIKQGDKYICINQVKGGKSKNPLDCKAVMQLLLKIIKYNNESIEGFFHIAKSEFTLKDAQTIYKELKEYYKEILELLDEMKNLSKREFETILSNHNIKNNIINDHKLYICSNFKNVEFKNLQTAIEENRSEFKELFEKYYNCEEDFKNIFNKITVHDEIIEDLSSANELIEEDIERIAQQISKNFDANAVRFCLQEKLSQIINESKNSGNSMNTNIKFEDIIKLFEKPFYNYMFKFKEQLIMELEGYKDNYCEGICNNDNKNCAIQQTHKMIYEISEENFADLIQNIFPHRNISKQVGIDESIISETVFDSMCKISDIRLRENVKIAGYSGGKWFWSIAFNLSKVKRLSQLINENRSNILQLLYEADFLIIKTPTEKDEVISIEQLSEKELKEIDKQVDYCKIGRTKKIGIKSIDEAEKIFKGEIENV